MIKTPKEAWLETKTPDLIWLGDANKEMMTFNHMSQVREEVFVKRYAIWKKNKIWSRGVAIFRLTWESSGSHVFRRSGFDGLMTKRDALDQVQKLRLAARSQLFNCELYADRGMSVITEVDVVLCPFLLRVEPK